VAVNVLVAPAAIEEAADSSTAKAANIRKE